MAPAWRLQEQPVSSGWLCCWENAGRVVTPGRPCGRKNLGPPNTFVDFDHSLNTAVNKVREALGRFSHRVHGFVETLARPRITVSSHRSMA